MTYPKELYNSLMNQNVYTGLIYGVFGLFAFGMPIYIYLLIKVMPPTTAKTYRYLLTSCGISSFALTFIRAIWIPVPTLPVMGVYSAGIISNFGPTANLICLNLYFVSMVNMQLCCSFCLIYQFSALRPFSWISMFGNCPTRVLISYGTYFVVMITIISTLLHSSVIDRQEFQQYANLTNNFYVLELIKHQPSWVGFSTVLKPSIIGLGIFTTVPDLLVATLAVVLTIKLWFIIEADKSRVSSLTASLEKNLYRTFVFRTTSLLTMFTIPYLGVFLTIFLGIPNPKLGLIFHGMIVFQTGFCMIGTILMIKVFRDYCFPCFNKKVHDSSSANSSSGNGAPTTQTARSETLPPLRIKNVY